MSLGRNKSHRFSHADVTVVGCGQSGPKLAEERSIPELVLDAVEAALADGDLGWADIDAAVTASVDLFDGLTASNLAVTEVVGAVMGPETRVAGDGLVALIQAVHQIRAGAYGRVLVVAHGKASMAPYWELTEWAMDPIFLQPLGVSFLTFAGLQARLLALRANGAEQRWAERAVERHAAAGWTPARTLESVLESPAIATPLRREMMAPLADGACAVVLSGEAAASPGTIRVTGTGFDLEPHDPGTRDLTAWAGLGRACARAFAAAGVDDPRNTFDVVEPSCLFPHEEDLFRAASGIGDATPISESGGLYAGAIPIASGLSRFIAARHVLRRGGGRRALVHGTWGPAGQAHAVAALEVA